jgi:hypothetical protein
MPQLESARMRFLGLEVENADRARRAEHRRRIVSGVVGEPYRVAPGASPVVANHGDATRCSGDATSGAAP